MPGGRPTDYSIEIGEIDPDYLNKRRSEIIQKLKKSIDAVKTLQLKIDNITSLYNQAWSEVDNGS